MTSAQVVETSVTVTDNSPFQDYPHPDDHTTRSTVTPGFKPFTVKNKQAHKQIKNRENVFTFPVVNVSIALIFFLKNVFFFASCNVSNVFYLLV